MDHIKSYPGLNLQFSQRTFCILYWLLKDDSQTMDAGLEIPMLLKLRSESIFNLEVLDTVPKKLKDYRRITAGPSITTVY